MDYIITILKSSLEDFRRNKVRTLLTSLGILIGVASVVLLVAMGLGLKRYIDQQFQSLGANLIFILPGNIVSGGQFQASAPPIGGQFDDHDVTSLNKIPGVIAVLPAFTKTVKVQAQGNSDSIQLIATTADVFSVMNLEMDQGTAFTKSDVAKGSKVVIIGPNVANKLFTSAGNAVGRTIKIETQSFKVLGVPVSKGGGGFSGPGLDDRVYMPATAALSFNPEKKYFAIYLQAGTANEINSVIDEAKKVLLKRYKSDEFSVVQQSEFLNAINSIFSILNSVLVSIAAISLVVGGVGIMNIMYVSVTERIREIGIRRAVGATSNDILIQFIVEAIILSLLGGFLGLLLSYLVVLGIQRVFPAYIDLFTVIVALGVSSAIGLIFGVFPAKKAADLSPIEAIRYE
jgi:putative ABC transport system permease protein